MKLCLFNEFHYFYFDCLLPASTSPIIGFVLVVGMRNQFKKTENAFLTCLRAKACTMARTSHMVFSSSMHKCSTGGAAHSRRQQQQELQQYRSRGRIVILLSSSPYAGHPRRAPRYVPNPKP